MTDWWWWPVAGLIGYLLGSIPVGALVGGVAGGVDLRRFGSGKTGATNVLRTLGPGAAAIVVTGDLLKGVLAVLLVRWLFGPGWPEAIAGILAAVGHNYSVFLQFHGGRGMIVSTGAMLALNPWVVLIGVPAGLAVIALTRYVSLGSILGCVVGGVAIAVFWLLGWDSLPHAAFGIAAALFVIWSHRDNIKRLLAGTERKLGQKAETNAVTRSQNSEF